LAISSIVINDWNIFAHGLFLARVEELTIQVESLQQKYPNHYQQKNATKRLAAIYKLAFDVIPQDPTRSEYRPSWKGAPLGETPRPHFPQSNTLGEEYKHWFRAKFFQQYRLFFRYHQESKIIVYAWVNDEKSKRAYDSKTDAYLVFQKMLDNGHPPNDWQQLLIEAEVESSRLVNIISETR